MDFRTGESVAEHDGQSELLLAGDAAPTASNGKAIGMNADDKGSEALVAAMTAGAATALAAAAKPVSDSKTINARRFAIETNAERDALLTAFGKQLKCRFSVGDGSVFLPKR